MPEYLSPGVYVEEISSGIRPIEGVSTSVAGFLGRTERGPEGANYITSFAEYERWYGGFLSADARLWLPYAVNGFFENGGRRAFVCRVAAETDELASGEIDVFDAITIGRGNWGNTVYVLLSQGSNTRPSAPLYRVSVAYFRTPPAQWVNPLASRENLLQLGLRVAEANPRENFDNLRDVPGAADDIVTVVNARSQYIRLTRRAGTGAVGTVPDDAQVRAADLEWTQLATGVDEPVAPDVDDFIGSYDNFQDQPQPFRGTGLRSLDLVDEVSLLIAPEHVDIDTLDQELVNSCERLRDRVALLSVGEQAQQDLQNLRPTIDTSYAAFYHPWIRVRDPSSNQPVSIPPVGHVAGICARTDLLRGVHKAPANEVASGAVDLNVPVTKERQDLLNPRGVNCFRDFRADGRGIRLWGARTMSSDPEWRYLNVRRLFLFLEESIDQGIQWVPFEPNYEPTWAAVRRTISDFLLLVWRSGALAGVTADEAYFVKCDRETMTQADIDAGRLICLVGVAPVKPAEFVIIRIFQKTIEATA